MNCHGPRNAKIVALGQTPGHDGTTISAPIFGRFRLGMG